MHATNKAGYTATLVACGWVGAVLEKVTGSSGQEPYAQKAQKRQKSKKGTDQPTDQQTDIGASRVAFTRLKKKNRHLKSQAFLWLPSRWKWCKQLF